MCGLFGVQRSSYYLWKSRLGKRRISREDEEKVGIIIDQIFVKSRKSYGAVRVHDQLIKMKRQNRDYKKDRRLRAERRL